MRLGRSETLISQGILQRTVTAISRARQRPASSRIHVITKKLRDLRLSKTEGYSQVVHKCHTPFSIKMLGAREDFKPACESSAFQDNNALVSVSPSTRGDLNPTAGFHHFKRYLKKIVSWDEHCFGCLVFVFVQVNQVTARVKSESMVTEEGCACTGSVWMTFAESSSLTGPSDGFTNIFFAFFQTDTKTMLARTRRDNG